MGDAMKWGMLALGAVLMLGGCEHQETPLEKALATAEHAEALADEATTKVEELETKVSELEDRVDSLESDKE
jgi:outer membrane murein-binding lipoprotein Lpp